MFQPVSRGRSGSLYRQLTDALCEAIRGGEMPPGTRLIPERQLAEQLGVSRTTVMNAYRELESLGLVRGQVGRGTYVCAEPAPLPFAWRGRLAGQETGDPFLSGGTFAGDSSRMVSFAIGAPALDVFPVAAFQRLLTAALDRDPAAVLGHGPTEGQPALRQALARRYRLPADRLLILSGSMQGLDLLAKGTLEPADTVVMDQPGCRMAIRVFQAAGVRMVGWDLRRADFEELEDLFLRYRPKLLYTNPTYQNPTGTTLSLSQRRDLIELAARYRVPIVEDSAYQDLHFDTPAPPPLYRLDQHGIVIALNTFSKVLAPGLRVGWLAGPRAIVHQLAGVKVRSDLHTANLTQLALAEFVESGLLDSHLEKLRREHKRRLDTLLAAITTHIPAGGLLFQRPIGGIYLWCKLGFGLQARAVVDRARAAGVALAGADMFTFDGSAGDELRICFGNVSPTNIGRGIRALAGVIESERAHPTDPIQLFPIV